MSYPVNPPEEPVLAPPEESVITPPVEPVLPLPAEDSEKSESQEVYSPPSEQEADDRSYQPQPESQPVVVEQPKKKSNDDEWCCSGCLSFLRCCW